MTTIERTLPHSVETERAVLGAAISSAKRAQALPFALRGDDFLLPAHRDVFEAIVFLAKAGKRADSVSLGAELRRRNAVPRLEGGLAYVGTLEAAGDRFGWDQHVKSLQQLAALRGIIAACSEASARAYGMGDAREVADQLGRDLVKIATGSGDDLTPIGDVMPEVLAAIEERARTKRKVTGARTGINEVDVMTTGFQPGNLVGVAALTGAGKTALAMQTAINVALDGGTVLAINLEMTRAELAERVLVHQARIDSDRVRRGEVDYGEFKNTLQPHANRIAETSIFLEDAVFSLADITTKARVWRARHPDKRGLLIVDFLQLVHHEAGSKDGRARQIGIIAETLKKLAKELGVPVLMVSQLNRVAAKSGEEPSIADLKESSSIEQACDVIILGHNPSQTDDGPITLILGKNRHGKRGRVQVRWIARWYRFEDLVEEPAQEVRHAD